MELRIEPDLKYCVSCREEYRADITTCADCGKELITGSEFLAREAELQSRRASRSMEIHPEDDLVTLRKGPVLIVKEFQQILARYRIPALAVGAEGGCGKGCCAELSLQVRRQDAAEAIDVLQREHARSTGLEEHDTAHTDAVFDPQAAETTCPACGCRFATTTTVCPECGLCFA